MKSLKYSAGMVSKGFWFQQFKNYIKLFNDGKSDEEIKRLQEENNILLAPSKSYGIKMVGEVSRRTRALPESIRNIFFDLSVDNQKLINLLGVLMTDRLFFEFVYEIYREDVKIGIEEFENKKLRIYFKDKGDISEDVRKYKDNTIKRLSREYKTYLKETGLLKEVDNKLYYKKAILDLRLEEIMKAEGLDYYLKAITGVA